jgi:hypothetical protein
MNAQIGVDISERQAAICVAEPDWPDGGRPHFRVRHLERLPPGTHYSGIGRRLKEIWSGLDSHVESADFFVNATVAGIPAIEVIRDESDVWLQVACFYHGHQKPGEHDEVLTLGKAYLVRRLQVLFQEHRLHLPENPETRTLLGKLPSYELRVPDGADNQIGAFSVGSQDDLVNAIGLAVHSDPYKPLTAEEHAKLDELFPPDPVATMIYRATGIPP